MKFRVQSANGGAGKVEWLPSPTSPDKSQSMTFQTTGGDWQEISVKIPTEGALGVLRLYLPAQKQPMLVDWIEIQNAYEKKRSDF